MYAEVDAAVEFVVVVIAVVDEVVWLVASCYCCCQGYC